MAQQPVGFVPDGFEPDTAPKTETLAPASAVSRFTDPILGALTSPVHFATALATDPAGLYESLVNKSAEHFTKASELWKKQQYGPAIHRAIAGVIPPYGVVPEAADKLRTGDVAGAAGDVVATGLTPKILGAEARAVRGAVRGIVKTTPAVVRTVSKIASPELAARLVKHGTTAAGAIAGGPAGAIVGSEIGAELAARIKARLTPMKPTGGPSPRLVKGGTPPLSDQLHTILEEIHQEPTGGATAPAAAGSTLGGEQAATSSMRMLAEKPDLAQRFSRTMSQEEASPVYRATDFTKPTKVKVPIKKIVATQEGFQDPIIEQYRVHPGSELPSASKVGEEYILNDGHHRVLGALARGETEIELNAHPVDQALALTPQPRAMWLTERGQQVTAPQARMMERTGRSAPYRSETGPGRTAPIPLSEAMTAVRDAAKAADVKLTAAEVAELVKVVRTGRPAAQAIDALAIHKALKDTPAFARLPGEAEVAADLSQRGPLGGRTRQPGKPASTPSGKSPQQLLNEEALVRRRAADQTTRVATGNPFR